MFLAGQTGAWYAGALPANYRSVASSGATIVNQTDNNPLLTGNFYNSYNEESTNRAQTRIALLTSPGTYGSSNNWIYSGWVFMSSTYLSQTGSYSGYAHLYGRTSTSGSNDTGSPDLAMVSMNVFGASNKQSARINTNDSSDTTDCTVTFTVNIETTDTTGSPQQSVVGGISDADSANWSNKWVNLTVYYNGNGDTSSGFGNSGQDITNNPVGFIGNDAKVTAILTRNDGAYQQITENYYGSGGHPIDMDTSVNSEYFTVNSNNWDQGSPGLADLRVGPQIITTTANKDIIHDADTRANLGIYSGPTLFSSPQIQMTWQGSTDADKLVNHGSFGNFDDDTTGTITGTGTFQ